TALDARLPLDFEGQWRDGIVFLGHSKLLQSRGGGSARATLGGSGFKLLDSGDLRRSWQDVTGVANSRRDDRLEAWVESLGNLLGDFLKISSKRYNATIPIAADYLTSRRTTATKTH